MADGVIEFQHLTENLGRDPDYLDRLIDEHQAAAFLRVSVSTLRGWRVSGRGPRWIKLSGNCVRYRRRELIEHADAHCVRSTCETPDENGTPAPTPAAA